MKKLSILLLGALIAMTALQGCSKDQTSTPDQAIDQTTTDTPSQPNDWAPDADGRVPVAKFEIALGGGDGDEPVFNIVHNPSYTQAGNLAETPNSVEFGIGQMDVQVTGNGLTVGGTACPNSIDPQTGLPWAVDPCAGNRGTFTGSTIQANLTITNITGGAGNLSACGTALQQQTATCHDWTPTDDLADGLHDQTTCCNAVPPQTGCTSNAGAACTEGSLGACDGFWYTDSVGDQWQDMPNSICVYNRDCSPRRALIGAVPPLPPAPINKDPSYAYCMGTIVIAGAVGNDSFGFCEDGITACDQATSDADGQNTVCGAGTCSNMATNYCATASDCPPTGVCGGTGGGCNLDADCTGTDLPPCVGATATCNGRTLPAGWAADARNECWTGCGSCINGRNFNCLGVQYTGSLPQGGPTDLDAKGLVKCSGGPYLATNPDIPALQMWMAGNPTGLDRTASMPFMLEIDSTNSSYCIHSFKIWEDPYGDANWPECRATCGDGYIATQNATAPGGPEVCEPVDDRSGRNIQRGCGTPGGANPCQLKGVCSDNGAACECGANADGCGGAGTVADNLARCLNPLTATCDMATFKDCACAGCATGCADVVTTCGNGVLDVGEACDPGIDPVCCNAVSCQAAANTQTCGAAPVGACDAQDTCDGVGVGAGACVDNVVGIGIQCQAAGANATCDPADVCNGVLKTCPANLAPALTPCGAALTEPDCNPDSCDGAGLCNDVAALPDLSVCNDNGGVNCCSGVCLAVACPSNCTITSLTTRGNGSSGKHTFNIDGGPPNATDPVNGGMTYNGSHLPAIDYFMAVPNESTGPYTEAATGDALVDYVFYNVQQAVGNPDCTSAPKCVLGVTGLTEVAQGGNLYVTYAQGPDLGIVANDQTKSTGLCNTINFGSGACQIDADCTANGNVGPCNGAAPLGNTFPSFAAATNTLTVSCCPGGSALCGAPYDAGPANSLPTSSTITVGIADGGPIDMFFPAAGGTKRVYGFGYCPQSTCDPAMQGGVGIQNAQFGYFFDPLLFSTAVGDFTQFAPVKGASPGNRYAIDPSCRTGSTGMDTSQLAAGFVISGSDSNTNNCEWHMANLHEFNIKANAQAAGTISTIGVSMWSQNGVTEAFPNDQGWPVNASQDAATFDRPITNGEATVLWQ